jgi:hypothetical protein
VCWTPHVIGDDDARPANAEEELVALLVGVLSPDLLRGHVVDDEVAPRQEWHVTLELADRQTSPRVLDVIEVVQGDTGDRSGLHPLADGAAVAQTVRGHLNGGRHRYGLH